MSTTTVPVGEVSSTVMPGSFARARVRLFTTASSFRPGTAKTMTSMATTTSRSEDNVAVTNFEERVIKVISQAVPASYRKVKITPESNLARDLGLDSLAVAMLVFKFEEEFGIDMDGVEDDLDMSSLRAVKDVLDGLIKISSTDAQLLDRAMLLFDALAATYNPIGE